MQLRKAAIDPDQLKETVRARRADGEPAKSIAADLDISLSRIYPYTKKGGKNRRRKGTTKSASGSEGDIPRQS